MAKNIISFIKNMLFGGFLLNKMDKKKTFWTNQMFLIFFHIFVSQN